jgi:hypothetical protein
MGGGEEGAKSKASVTTQITGYAGQGLSLAGELRQATPSGCWSNKEEIDYCCMLSSTIHSWARCRLQVLIGTLMGDCDWRLSDRVAARQGRGLGLRASFRRLSTSACMPMRLAMICAGPHGSRLGLARGLSAYWLTHRCLLGEEQGHP